MNPDIDRFYRDLLLDTFASVSAAQWRERAEVFRAARPHPDDFPGRSTLEERRERWRRLTEVAKACDARAAVIEQHGADFPEVEVFPIWGEAA